MNMSSNILTKSILCFYLKQAPDKIIWIEHALHLKYFKLFLTLCEACQIS
ncbi:hypothetical protein ACRRTK_002294 [Alexandromys fortis]